MSLDDDLRSAADELRSELTSVTPPAFEPPSPQGRRVAGAIVGVLVVAGGWWGTQQLLDQQTPLDASGNSTVATTLSTSPPESTTTSPAPGLPSVSDGTDQGADQGDDSQDPEGEGPDEEGSDDQAYDGPGLGQGEVVTSPIERPGESPVTEPDFGTSLRRITASQPEEVTLPVYSRTQVYNADGSLLLLYRTGVDYSGHVLYDGIDLAEIGPVAIDAFDIEDVYWDRSDPNVLRYIEAGSNRLIELDVRAGDRSTVHEFDGCDTVDTGDASGTTTSGSDLLAVVCRRGGEPIELISFDLAEGVELARAPASPAAPIAMRSGAGFIQVDDDGLVVLGRDLRPTAAGRIYTGAVTGAVAATDGSGRDVAVVTLFSDADANGLAIMFDLVSGERTDIVGQATGWGYPIASSSLSVAGGPNGSMLAATNWRMSGAGLLVDEVVLISLEDPTPSVLRLAHHRLSEGGEFGPWHQANTAVSPDGTEVLFSSDWGSSGSIDTYVIDVPTR